MPEKDTHSLIIRIFSGEANPEEKKQVKEWINSNPKNNKTYADLQEIWLASGNEKEYDTEKAICRFRQKIRKNRAIPMPEILKYAAIIILLISLPLVYFWGNKGTITPKTYTTITCNFGDKSTVTLPDGSLVYLNSGSKLTFNNNFSEEYRQVFLEGEAYFSVKRNEEIPFKVKASEIEIEVLGTEFDLKAYPEENLISTTLVKGKVKISSGSQQIIMKPSKKAIFNRTEKKFKMYNLSDTGHETEWKDGRLIFRNESLGELELKLERWFDVDIEFGDDQVKKRRFSGVLERESILKAVSYFGCSKHVGYRINGNEITFYSK